MRAPTSTRRAFSQPQGATFGNTGRNQFRGPGAWNLDFSLFRAFPVGGAGRRFEFRTEVFNLLNHPNWGNPDTDVNSSTFGQTFTVGTGRARRRHRRAADPARASVPVLDSTQATADLHGTSTATRRRRGRDSGNAGGTSVPPAVSLELARALARRFPVSPEGRVSSNDAGCAVQWRATLLALAALVGASVRAAAVARPRGRQLPRGVPGSDRRGAGAGARPPERRRARRPARDGAARRGSSSRRPPPSTRARGRSSAATTGTTSAAVAETRLAHHDRAAALLREAVTLSPTLPARLALADALFESGAVDDSEPLYRALATEPAAEPHARYGLGRVLASRGDHDGALEEFDAALAPLSGLRRGLVREGHRAPARRSGWTRRGRRSTRAQAARRALARRRRPAPRARLGAPGRPGCAHAARRLALGRDRATWRAPSGEHEAALARRTPPSRRRTST